MADRDRRMMHHMQKLHRDERYRDFHPHPRHHPMDDRGGK